MNILNHKIVELGVKKITSNDEFLELKESMVLGLGWLTKMKDSGRRFQQHDMME